MSFEIYLHSNYLTNVAKKLEIANFSHASEVEITPTFLHLMASIIVWTIVEKKRASFFPDGKLKKKIVNGPFIGVAKKKKTFGMLSYPCFSFLQCNIKVTASQK